MVKSQLITIIKCAVFMAFLNANNLVGPSDSDLQFILNTNPLRDVSLKETARVRGGRSASALAIRPVFKRLISLYQSYISTQDEDSCSYTKTCSAFSREATMKYGLIEGILITSDRLLRCHPLARRYHPLDKRSYLAIDLPVEAYRLVIKN